jgi:hypothetical protein
MRRLAFVAAAFVLVSCGPQVEIDDAGSAGDSGTVGSSGDGGDGAIPPAPATTATPMPPNPTTPTSLSDTASMTMTTSPTTQSDVTTSEPPPPPGGACEDHFDCPTLLCLELSDAPPDPDAYCENAPAGGATRFTGTMRSISTQVPVPGSYVVVASALEAVTNPAMANPLAEGFTGRAGLLDITSPMPLAAQIGAVAIADAPGHYLSATGIAAPQDDGTYLPGNGVHDLWIVSTQDLELWSERLATEPELAPYLPLGELGGIVGILRDPEGVPRSGFFVGSDAPSSDAIIRFPTPDGMQADVTSELGLFIILNPALGETFSAVTFDVQSDSVAAASTNGVVFTVGLIL